MHQDGKDFYDAEDTSKCLSFLRILWKFCRCIFSHVTLVSLVVAYCLLGAYAFESLEANHEIQVKESIKYVRSNVTKRIWTITEDFQVLRQENWTEKVVKELVKFEADLLDKMKKDGWDGSEELKNIQWTFAGALFYSIIVITTIGYGHIAPKTQNGKVVTIFYAILGIPLMLLCLSNIGKVMASSFRFLYWKICCYVCTKPPKPRRHRHHGNFARSQSLRQPGRSISNRSSNLAAGSSCYRKSTRIVNPRSMDTALPPSAFSETIARSPRSHNASKNTRNERDRCETSAGYASPPQRYLSPVNADVICEPPTALAAPSSLKYRSENVPTSLKTMRVATKYPVGTRSLDRKYRPVPSSNDAVNTPVLFNKYATDEPETTDDQPFSASAGMRRDETSARRCRSVEASVDLEMLRSMSLKRAGRSNNARSWNNRREAAGGRVMSPIGLTALPRQIYVDNLDLIDYDYMTGGGAVVGSSGIDHELDDPAVIKPVPIWLCVFLVVSYILGGAFLFAEWESWPYLDSAYFCFITLTTIGFGDLVPAHRLNAHQGIALCSLYLLFGIALLVMSFNLVQEEVVSSVKNVAKRLGIIKDDEQNGGIDGDDGYYEEDDDYESDAYPTIDREESSRRYYGAEYDRPAGIYYGAGVADGFSPEAASSSSRRTFYHQDHLPIPSRFSPR